MILNSNVFAVGVGILGLIGGAAARADMTTLTDNYTLAADNVLLWNGSASASAGIDPSWNLSTSFGGFTNMRTPDVHVPGFRKGKCPFCIRIPGYTIPGVSLGTWGAQANLATSGSTGLHLATTATSGLVSVQLPETAKISYDSGYQTANAFKAAFTGNVSQSTAPTINLAAPALSATVSASINTSASSNVQIQKGGGRQTLENNTTTVSTGGNVNLFTLGLSGDGTASASVLGTSVQQTFPNSGVEVSLGTLPISVGVGPISASSGGKYVNGKAEFSTSTSYFTSTGSITDALLDLVTLGSKLVLPPLSLDLGVVGYNIDDFSGHLEEKLNQSVSVSARAQAKLYFSNPVNYSFVVPCTTNNAGKCTDGTTTVTGTGSNTTVMTLPSGATADVSWVGTPGALLGQSYSVVDPTITQTTSLVDTFSLGLKDLAGYVKTAGFSVAGQNFGLDQSFCLGCLTFAQANVSALLDASSVHPTFTTADFGFVPPQPQPQGQVGYHVPGGTVNDPTYITGDDTPLQAPQEDTVTYLDPPEVIIPDGYVLDVEDVPEPGSLWLLVAGLVGLAAMRRRALA